METFKLVYQPPIVKVRVTYCNGKYWALLSDVKDYLEITERDSQILKYCDSTILPGSYIAGYEGAKGVFNVVNVNELEEIARYSNRLDTEKLIAELRLYIATEKYREKL